MVVVTMVFCLSNSSQGGKLFLIRKFFPNFAILPKSGLMLTASRDLVSLPNVRGWETFSKNGKLLSHFEKVSHPSNPYSHKGFGALGGKLGNFFLN